MTDSGSRGSSVGFSRLFYKLIGTVLSRYPGFILIVTLSIAIILSWVGISQNGFPKFGDPYLGFQTRFTPISDRLVSLENLRLEVNKLEILENYPGERISEKQFKRRRRRSGMCTDFPLEEYGRVALELKGVTSENLLSRESLSLICFFQKLILNVPSYQHVCEVDENLTCCSMWSLPNYVAQWANKSDCIDIKDEDVKIFERDLNTCNIFYSNSTQNEDCVFRRNQCLKMCYHGGIIHSALYYTIDKNLFTQNTSKYAMVILPVPKSSKDQSVMEEFQKTLWGLRNSLPQEVATIGGFDFGGKDPIFKNYLISDLQYVALASVISFSVVLIFTKSFLVTVISFGVLIFSLGISYFLYTNTLSISYFPFMNMLVAIIILGIGTDATLIVSSAWERNKCSESGIPDRKRRIHVMIQTMEDTTSTLFITTCTTAGAFFASLTSSITTIRCFSIFAGTAIITSFFLLYVCVPITLDLSDRIWTYLKSLLPPPSQSKLVSKFYKVCNDSSICRADLNSHPKLKLFDWLSSSTIFWTVSFFFCISLLVWSVSVIFISPGFQLPNSEQFQLLTASHPVETFDRTVASAFDHNSTPETEDKLTVYLIWGIQAKDTGNGFDPNNAGKLQFDPEFSLDPPENQKWMKKLCKRIQKSKFYDPVLNDEIGLNLDACFMTTFVEWMKRDCYSYLENNQTYKPCCNSSKFPYDEDTFHHCIGLAARDVYRTPSLYFQPDIAGPKFFGLKYNGELDANRKSLATFTVRIRTNITYSLVYEKMDTWYREMKAAFEEILHDTPSGLENGFFISSHFDFYDLQKSLMEETWNSLLLSIGLCFFFLLVASRSIGIATGAILAIFAIVLVTAGFLIQFFNWKLGVFESIAVTVAVGLSDFTAHHSLEFSKENSVAKMTSATFFSAVSTVIMGLSLFLFSSVLVYEQIGSFFVVLVVTSWIYSVFFLTPVLMGMNKFTQWSCLCFSTSYRHESKDDEDANSHSDLIVENINATRPPEKKPHLMMEKWRELKKSSQETTV